MVARVGAVRSVEIVSSKMPAYNTISSTLLRSGPWIFTDNYRPVFNTFLLFD